MILIVGHGASIKEIPPEWIDEQETVVRLKYKKLLEHWYLHVGTKIDVLCSYNPARTPAGIEVWPIDGNNRRACVGLLKQFHPKKRKGSTGFCACVIARLKHPDAEIGAIGFDYTFHPERTPSGWLHDTEAESAALRHLNIKELTPDII